MIKLKARVGVDINDYRQEEPSATAMDISTGHMVNGIRDADDADDDNNDDGDDDNDHDGDDDNDDEDDDDNDDEDDFKGALIYRASHDKQAALGA